MISNARKVVGILIFSFLIFGILDACFPKFAEAGSLIHGFLIILLLSIWCWLHAEEEHVTLPLGYPILSFFLGLFGVFIYLFRAFGFKKGGIKALLAIVATGVAVAIYEGAFFATSMFL